jgi:hypothetical protein
LVTCPVYSQGVQSHWPSARYILRV